MKGSFARNTLTSIFTTAVDFGTLTGLVELFGVNYVAATFIGSIVGFLTNFTINRYWSFAATDDAMHWQFVRVIPVQAGSTGLQTLGVWLFTSLVGIQYMASKIIVSALVYLGWNYPMNRFWVFRAPPKAPMLTPE